VTSLDFFYHIITAIASFYIGYSIGYNRGFERGICDMVESLTIKTKSSFDHKAKIIKGENQ
jgi:hypothetical protein